MFDNYKYERISIDEIKQKYQDLTNKFIEAKSGDEQIKIIDQIHLINDHISSMFDIASIRNSINTNDEFYEEEMDYINEMAPVLEGIENEFNKELLKTKYKSILVEHFGQHLFNMIEVSLKTFDERLIPLLVEENKLITKYQKLMAGITVSFEEKEYTLAQMGRFNGNKDRRTRKKAFKSVSEAMMPHISSLDEIYDKLVDVRNKQALILGLKNYVELGYNKLGRTDYNEQMVKEYREQIKENIVPLCKEIIDKQKKRLGLKDLKIYDLALVFKEGNPEPSYDSLTLIEKARLMYQEMSKETADFFNYMQQNKLMDLIAKPGKAAGGYCTYIPDYRSPFIFANFNGTKGDVDVLTHEAGHAFQAFQSKDITVPEYRFPTLEACEIHSMSMEFLAYPWMDSFFESAQKYRFAHLAEAITFLPYGALVDEFQHFVYENPEISAKERRTKWLELEKIYLPYKDYDGDEYYTQGCFWFKQSHIFQSPFYYIDYTLAQVCAFQFLILDRENHNTAWNKYMDLCKLGGTKSFTNLLDGVGLLNPFESNVIKTIAKKVQEILDFFELIIV